MYEPLVEMGKPYNYELFDHYEVDGVNIYMSPSLIARDNQCRISFTKILWYRKLNIDGIIV